MSEDHIAALLRRAADTATPSTADPAPQLVRRARRRLLRRRALGVAGVAVATAGVVTGTAVLAPGPADRGVVVDRSAAQAPTGTPRSFAGVTVVVPDGWTTSEVGVFDECTAEPRTVYLAKDWQPRGPGSLTDSSRACGPTQPWMAIVETGEGLSIPPERLVVSGSALLQVTPFGASSSSYRPFVSGTGPAATTAYISAAPQTHADLLQRVSWPAGAPRSDRLSLPARITDVVVGRLPNIMIDLDDAGRIQQVRRLLEAQRTPVPAGRECPLDAEHTLGLSLSGDATDALVIVGDATCPQAVSSHGGRVRVPPTLQEELLRLVDVDGVPSTD